MNIQLNGWEDYFNLPILENTLLALEMFPEKDICPRREDTFRAFKLCNPKKCKVITVSMDPYPQPGIATGVAFGNKVTTLPNKISSSLRVIRRAVLNPLEPINGPRIFDISLEDWAKQGVLLLNAALTVRVGEPGSHILLWRPFMEDFLKEFSSKQQGCVYLFFGKQAEYYKNFIHPNNKIMEVYHPAYYARIGKDMDSKVFDEINDYLIKQYGREEQIKWFRE